MNDQELSGVREVTIKNWTVTVSYPKDKCSRCEAWKHLEHNYPRSVPTRQQLKLRFKNYNPWRRSHSATHWSWYAKLAEEFHMPLFKGGAPPIEPISGIIEANSVKSAALRQFQEEAIRKYHGVRYHRVEGLRVARLAPKDAALQPLPPSRPIRWYHRLWWRIQRWFRSWR